MINKIVRCHFCEQEIPFDINTGEVVKFVGTGQDKFYCRPCLAILYEAKLVSDENAYKLTSNK